MGCCQPTATTTSEVGMQDTRELASTIASAGTEQEDWVLRAEVLRVFDLAQKDHSGRMDMNDFAYLRKSQAMVDTLMGKFCEFTESEPNEARHFSKWVATHPRGMGHGEEGPAMDLSGCISCSEWSSYFHKLSQKNDRIAAQVLKLYEKQILDNSSIKANFAIHDVKELSNWPWRQEVLRVFDLADKDHNGQLDMDELCTVRNNASMAGVMMLNLDTDLTGTLSQEEWLNYFYRLFSKKESSAKALLKLYERQIQQPKTITIKKSTTWDIIDAQQSYALPGGP
jgi:Ca2+-binding EF-hand superfamily protein